jgi:flagellar basal body rod protein FlgG
VASEVATIQSLKAVDAWIDVINANINGGVRTAFKSSRLKFAGANVDVSRSGSSTSLPLQFPEAGLTTANTVIDFSAGAITASTDPLHMAIQDNPSRFFILINKAECTLQGAPPQLNPNRGPTTNGGMYLSRDGEFHWGPLEDLGDGVPAYYLKHSSGLYVAKAGAYVPNGTTLYHNNTAPGTSLTESVRWEGVGGAPPTTSPPDIDGTTAAIVPGTVDIQSLQSLQFSRFGSTIFLFPPGQTNNSDLAFSTPTSTTNSYNAFTDGSLLTKSLEASNASMTQSVPELSLAQKLFSALTKVLQTKQTNVDGVLNLVR